VLGLDAGRVEKYLFPMKIAKSTTLVLALGMACSGCADPDPHAVNVTRPSIWSELFWSPPVPVSPAPLATPAPAPAPIVPNTLPLAPPVA